MDHIWSVEPFFPVRAGTVCIAKIQEIHTLPSESDALGRVDGGHLCVVGHLRQSTRKTSKRHTRIMGDREIIDSRMQYEWYDNGCTKDGVRNMEGAYYFLMQYEHHTQDWMGRVAGLIVEPVDQEKTTYRRIGAFHHLWGEFRSEHYPDAPKPEDYPEFADFDPNKFERHTITII